MGTEIDQEVFDERDYLRFAERLGECLCVLAQLLERRGFGVGPVTIGAELELFLIDGAGRPLPRNEAVRSAAADPRVTIELNQFNLELNASPTPLPGRPFSALGGELNLLLDHVATAARHHGGWPALIGILPTLTRADLGPGMMSDAPRYRALNAALRRLRPDPFHVRIAGDDPLELASEGVGMEGANSSFQIHLRVNPADFTRTYNAVQLATAPVLAVSGNSPTFLGHRLWDETRIALFKQSVAQKSRRVTGHRQYRRRGQLDRVVGAREVGRVDPEVDLQRAIRPFQPDVLTVQLERVIARDPDAERIWAQTPQAGIQRPVPRRIGHHARTQVTPRQGGQNADQRGPARMKPGGDGHVVKQHAQLTAERGEWTTRQRGG